MDKRVRSEVESLLRQPNETGESYGALKELMIEDYYVVGHGCFELNLRTDLIPRSIETVDPARIAFNKKWDGRDRTVPRYLKLDDSFAKAERWYASEELMCLVNRPMSYTRLGFSHVEALHKTVLTLLSGDEFMIRQILQPVSEKLISLGEGVTAQQVTDFKYQINQVRDKIAVVGGSKDPRVLNLSGTAEELKILDGCEWFVRQVAAVFNISTAKLKLAVDTSRANTEAMMADDLEAIEGDLTRIIELENSVFIDRYRYLGEVNLTFSYPIMHRKDERQQAAIASRQIGNQPWASINEARVRTGEKPLDPAKFPFADEPLINTKDGPVPMSIWQEVTAPSSVRVLKYVFFPASKTGFKYEYHPYYGMIRKITRQAGMSASTTSTTVTGTLTEGISAATTEYEFPAGTTPVDDVPRYTKRTDDWQGRTSTSPQETFYAVEESNGQSETAITVNESGFGVVTSTKSDSNGMVTETTTTKVPAGQLTTLLAKSVYTWTGRNLTKLVSTNETGLVRQTEFTYDGYNNQISVKEYDYGTSSPTLLRTTEIEYVTGSGWLANKLFSLPKTVKTIVGGNTVSKTVYEYDHGGNDSTLTLRTDIDTNTHDTFFNPSQPSWDEEVCPLTGGNGCVIIHHPGYGAASAYRGNVTKVTSFSDASLTTDTNAVVNEFNYDIAGNNVSATLSCCNAKTIDYGSSFSQTGYAYPLKEAKGSSPQHESEAAYNVYTGLVTSTIDENDQTTVYEYETDTLRPKKTTYPNGGYVQTEYSDKLVTNTNDLLPGFVRTTSTLESNKTVQSYGYFNGRGLGIRSASQTADGWNISATTFDHLGRPVTSYNPFVGSTPTASVPSGTAYTQVTEYDALGRAVKIQMQDGAEVKTQFSTSDPDNLKKTWVLSTDPAGKQRRMLYDALGRAVRVDEPDASGALGAVASPNQPTHYEYDANDNLSKVTQSDGTTTQERLFKYDSLSRLTHEKQVEANATLDDSGAKVTTGGLWTKVLKYNDEGLLTDAYDANGVRTQIAYDGLNRISSVSWTGESGYQTPTVTYTYDQARSGFHNIGALTKVTTAAVSGTQATPATETLYDYDLMGRLVKHQQTIGDQSYQIQYGYNLAGQLTSETYPSGRVVTTGYDSKGRLSSVADAQRTFLASVGFGSDTLPSQLTYGNGTVQNFDFNGRLQMESQELKRGSEVLQKYAYNFGEDTSQGFKNNGKLESVSSWIGTAKQWTQKFQYDSVGRLKEAKELKGDTTTVSYKQVFDYDRFGNLFRKSASNPTSGQENPLPYTAIETGDIDPAKNRFTSQTGTAYNDNGQVVADGKFRNLGYGYDANGRMIRVSEANKPDAVSVYDALGNRVAEKVNDVWQFVIYDAFGKIVAEYGGNPQQDAGGVKYYLQDWQGSVRAGLNAAGFVKSRTDHQAFGEDIASGVGLRTTAQGFGAPQANRQGYGLTEKDSATGLNHTWFRKNENRAGRWTSPDPYNGSASVGNPQSWNRYSYVANDPVNLVDPSGLIKLVCEYRFRTPLTCVIIDGHVDCEWDYAHADWGLVCTPEAGGSPSGYSGAGISESGESGGNGEGGAFPPPPGPPPPECNELAKQIRRFLNMLQRRARQLMENLGGLVPGDGPGTLTAYVDKYEEVQKGLRNRLNDWNTQGCGGPGPTAQIPENAWKWATDPPPPPGISPTADRSNLVQVAAGVTVTIGVAYVLYRIVRLAPSLAPPLWWSIPANVAVP